MEFVIWGAFATAFGLGLGYLGYLHSKLAYSIFITLLGVVTYFSSYVVDLVGGDSMAVSAMHAEAGQIQGIGILKNFMISIEAMGYLPQHVQMAILIFAVSFFLARIATWAYRSYGPKPAEESAAERKARVLASYGMSSMDDVRRLR